MMSYEKAGVEQIQWLATLDERVRETHLALHGAAVDRGERFWNGLRFPGDKEGDIGEWISCRCAVKQTQPGKTASSID